MRGILPVAERKDKLRNLNGGDGLYISVLFSFTGGWDGEGKVKGGGWILMV